MPTPVVTIISPAPDVDPGTTGGFSTSYLVARGTAIEIEVLYAPAFSVHCAIIMPAGSDPIRGVYTVFRAGAFQDLFTTSTMNAVTSGYRLQVRRDGGWPAGASIAFDVDTAAPAAATLVSIAVTPAASTFTPTGPSDRKQMVATGTYSDGSTATLTNTVTWSSSATGVATISNVGGSNGQVTAVGTAGGSSTITATLGAISGSTSLAVVINVTSIAVTPSASTFTAVWPADTYQMTATATYASGATANVTTTATWASSATGVATISNAGGTKGLVSPVAVGTTTITATVGAVPGNTSLQVAINVPLDGTTAVKHPTAEFHWPAMSWPTPATAFDLQDTSGSVVDMVRDMALTPVGSPQYRQAGEAGYASLGVGFSDGVAMGFSAPAGALWTPVYTPLLIYFEFQVRTVPTAGFTRALFAMTGAASAYVGLANNGTGQCRISLKGPSTASGTVDYLDGKRHFGILEWYPGTVAVSPFGQILNYTTSRYRLSTDKEQFSATWGGVSDSTKGLGTGGSASLLAPNAILYRFEHYVGTDSLAISAMGPKAALQARGITVTGY